jgi:thiol-disulfide isomerase/thioredoxin
MINSRRILALFALSLVVFAVWMLLGSGDVAPRAQAQEKAAAANGDMQGNLNQAAESIVAAAEQGVHQSDSENQLLERLDLSIEALRILGLLGATNTDTQASKLLDDVQAKAGPAGSEVVVRMRLARQLQRWGQLSKADREKAIDRFVTDVRSEGLTPGHADLLLRLTDNLEMNGQGQYVARAISGLLQEFRSSSEPSIQRRTPVMEGIVRRLESVGKPLELEGKLLDGTDFDWESYRGKVVLVDFFANWCGVCREEAPFVMQVYRAYRDKGFAIVGVSLDKQPQLAEAYRRETGFQVPTLFSSDPRAMEWKNPLAVKYGVTSLPRAILVDQQGNVVTTVARGENLVEQLNKLLGPPAGGLGDAGDAEAAPSGEEIETDSNVVPASFSEPSDAPNDASDSEGTAAPTVPE